MEIKWISARKNVFVFYNTPIFTHYGTILAVHYLASRWQGDYNMISVQAFAEKYDGKSVDFDKKYGSQCVDLFNYYNSEVLEAPFIGTPRTMGARDLYEVDSAARAKTYKKLPADSQLQVGDVLVYGEPHGRYVEGAKVLFLGHVAIFVGNGRMIQQNGKVSQKTTIDPVFYSGLLGILRPLRFIGQNSPQSVSPATNNKNKHTIKSGETFWGLEEKNGWTHGTLQQLNPGLDAKKLQIGTEIVTPGGPAPAPSAAETFYEIRSGDTFWALENAWQLPHGRLQELNPGVEPRSLRIGQRIRRS